MLMLMGLAEMFKNSSLMVSSELNVCFDPANRELEMVKGELLAKMKDFVWAVRKLDKAMRILDLPSNRYE
ncbi:MAG: hypothetical protein QXT26_07465 [Thermoproteota archaeon]